MDFITTAQNFGLAVACLGALGTVMWKAVKWFGTEIAKPVADRHIKFLDDLTTSTSLQSQALQTMALQQGQNVACIERIMLRMEEVLEKQDQLIRTVSEVRSQIGHMEMHADSVVIHEKEKGQNQGPPRKKA